MMHRHRSKSETHAELYLPIALAKLQADEALDVRYRLIGDRNDIELVRCRAAMDRIVMAAKARFADRLAAARHFPEEKSYHALGTKARDRLDREAKALKQWSINHEGSVFNRKRFDKSVFKPDKSAIGKAIKAAVDTIVYTETDILVLRFVMDSHVIERKNKTCAFGPNYLSEEDFTTVLDYLLKIERKAWMALLLFGSMVGGDMHKKAVVAAATEFLGLGEDADGFISTAIMQYLELGQRHPGITVVEEEKQFRREIEQAVAAIQ